MNRKLRRRREAFTLLELMIVLVILVVLLGLVGRSLLGTQKKADIKVTQIQIESLESALQDYYLDNRSFPSTEDGLQALLEPPSEESASRKWAGPYLDDDLLPLDPWDNPYSYEYPPANNTRDFPDIWSLGPDGEEDTEDDITNWRGDGGESDEGGDMGGGSGYDDYGSSAPGMDG